MDPLSITASIIAVLQAANAIISFCYDFANAVRDKPTALTKVVDEITQLRNVLEAIRNLAEKAERVKPKGEQGKSAQLPTLRLLCQLGGPLELCLHELN